MWRAVITGACVLMIGWTSVAWAAEKPITELPSDVLHLAGSLTEPIKQAARRSRQMDPVSGFWIGLVDGSVQSVKQTAQFLFFEDRGRHPSQQFRYSF